MNNLEITTTKQNDTVILTCTGRLDANRSGYLNDTINRLVREGSYHILLDLSGIEYLSSAGIRSLVTQYKNLKAVNGHLAVTQMSDNVTQVLSMVGMAEMLTQPWSELPAGKEEEAKPDESGAHGFLFSRVILDSFRKASVELFGLPELVFVSGYKPENYRVTGAAINQFGIGLGAIGSAFEECKNRFGEFIMLGKNVAYLPADGSKKPDFMISSGQLVVSVAELYGLHFQGPFSDLIRFNPGTPGQSIALSQLAQTFLKLTGYEQFALVMIAESGGLMGTTLNTSPIDGKKVFTFPEIKDTINFTTEPAYPKMLTLTVGFITGRETEETEKFTRPLVPGTSASSHLHTAVFPFIPLKKTEIDLNETIDYIFNNAELTDVLHLINDTREVTGQGESQFLKGFCWLVPVESIHVQTIN